MKSKYAGMTVNERLYVSGLLDQFDRAILEHNSAKARQVLREVDLKDESIIPILEKHGLVGK